jgi:hypothetical protein
MATKTLVMREVGVGRNKRKEIDIEMDKLQAFEVAWCIVKKAKVKTAGVSLKQP